MINASPYPSNGEEHKQKHYSPLIFKAHRNEKISSYFCTFSNIPLWNGQ